MTATSKTVITKYFIATGLALGLRNFPSRIFTLMSKKRELLPLSGDFRVVLLVASPILVVYSVIGNFSGKSIGGIRGSIWYSISDWSIWLVAVSAAISPVNNSGRFPSILISGWLL